VFDVSMPHPVFDAASHGVGSVLAVAVAGGGRDCARLLGYLEATGEPGCTFAEWGAVGAACSALQLDVDVTQLPRARGGCDLAPLQTWAAVHAPRAGAVFDAATGAPLAGADVRCGAHRTTTHADGRFRLAVSDDDGGGAATAVVRVRADGFVPTYLPAGAPLGLLSLLRAGAPTTLAAAADGGRVADARSGASARSASPPGGMAVTRS